MVNLLCCIRGGAHARRTPRKGERTRGIFPCPFGLVAPQIFFLSGAAGPRVFDLAARIFVELIGGLRRAARGPALLPQTLTPQAHARPSLTGRTAPALSVRAAQIGRSVMRRISQRLETWHCRPRRHRKDATGVVVTVHPRDDSRWGKVGGRNHHPPTLTKKNRPKISTQPRLAHVSGPARLCAAK